MFQLEILLTTDSLDRASAVEGIFDYASMCRDWNVSTQAVIVDDWRPEIDPARTSGAIAIGRPRRGSHDCWAERQPFPVVFVGSQRPNDLSVSADPDTIIELVLDHVDLHAVDRLAVVTDDPEDSLWNSLDRSRVGKKLATERVVVENAFQVPSLSRAMGSRSIQK